MKSSGRMMDNSNNSSCIMSCEKLDRVASWIRTNVASAFFASLERCACINLNTTDPYDEDSEGEEAKDRLLMLSQPAPIDNPFALLPTPTAAASSSD